MGGAKLIIAKHVACHVAKHSPDSRKGSMLSLLTGLGKGYCCILLKQRFAHTRRGLEMCRWRDVIAGSSAPISPIRNLFSQNQYEIASTGKEIVMVGRPELSS